MAIYAPLKTELCLSLLHHWDALRGDRLMPYRSELDPGRLKRALPYLVIFELRSPDQFVFRLAGTAVRDMLGVELTGRNLFDFTPDAIRRTRSWRFWASATHPCGNSYEIPVAAPSGNARLHEGISLPLQPDRADAPPQLLGLFAPIQGEPWLSRERVQQLEIASRFNFIDIGAGVPATTTAPESYRPDQ